MTFSDDAYLLRLSSDAIPNIHKTLAATGRPTKGRVPHFENCYVHGQVLYDFACDFKSISSKWKKILGMHAISVQNGLFKQQLITVNSGMFINCSWEEPMLVWYLRIPFFCFYLADKNVLLQKCRQRRTWIEMWKKSDVEGIIMQTWQDKFEVKWGRDSTRTLTTDMNMLKHVFPIVSNGRAYFLVLWKYLHS